MTKSRVLIVEDEKSIADTLIHVLESEGFDVQWVTLGGDAIELVSQQSFSLMILDIGLPDMTGFEFCKKIRLISDIPIIFGLLVAEDFALLMGSIFVFFVLATVMVATRKVNWYQLGGVNSK